jgi:hypothetical protein
MCIHPIVARQWLGKYVPAATNKRSNRRIVGCACLRVCLSPPITLLGNSSVKTLPLQRRIVGGVVFHVARVVSKESKRLLLPRTSCSVYIFSNQCALKQDDLSQLLFDLLFKCDTAMVQEGQ